MNANMLQDNDCDVAAANAAGVLYVIVLSENNWTALGSPTTAVLTPEHLRMCSDMYKVYLNLTEPDFAQLDKTEQQQQADALLCTFLTSVHASDCTGTVTCTVSWKMCGRTYQMSTEAMYAIALTIDSTACHMVQMPDLPFPAKISGSSDSNHDNIVAWLNCVVAHFYNTLNKQEQMVAKHILDIVEHNGLKRKLVKQQEEQKRLQEQQRTLEMQMAKTQSSISNAEIMYFKNQSNPNNKAALDVRRHQEHLFETMDFDNNADDETDTSPLKRRRQHLKKANAHLVRTIGSKYTPDALFTLCANPENMLDNAKALSDLKKTIATHSSADSGKKAAANTALLQPTSKPIAAIENLTVNYKYVDKFAEILQLHN